MPLWCEIILFAVVIIACGIVEEIVEKRRRENKKNV